MKSLTDSALEQLGQRPALRKVPTGSMWPVIAIGDEIKFQRSSSAARLLEVWVAQAGAVHVCHRVLWSRGNKVLLKGDFNLLPDGWFPRSALFGPVSEIQHRGRWRPANRLRDRVLGLALSGLGTGYQASRLVARRAAITLLGEPRARSLKSALKTALFRR